MKNNFNVLYLLLYPKKEDLKPCLIDTLKHYIDTEKTAHNLCYINNAITYDYYVFICNRTLNLIYSAFPAVNKNNIPELLERAKKERSNDFYNYYLQKISALSVYQFARDIIPEITALIDDIQKSDVLTDAQKNELMQAINEN